MSFSSEQMPAEQAYRSRCLRIWYTSFSSQHDIEHTHRIDREIIAKIKSCRFLVADFTEQKAGVYFERLALGSDGMSLDSRFAKRTTCISTHGNITTLVRTILKGKKRLD